jgi:hypothetical protein
VRHLFVKVANQSAPGEAAGFQGRPSMTHALRSTLFGLIVLMVSACQVATPAALAPSNSGDDSVPRPGSTGASIEGTIWHDLCDSGSDAEPALTETPPGCVQGSTATGPYHADGERQPGEPGLAGVEVALRSGGCPTGDILQTVISDAGGGYEFYGLDAGAYCVSVDPASDSNLALLPGQWTYPTVAEGKAAADVTVQANAGLSDVDFGWDRQFAPTHVHAAVFDSDRQLQIIDTGVDLESGFQPTVGLMPKGGTAQGQLYVLSPSPPAVMVLTDTGLEQLDFAQLPDYGLAVWPGQAGQPPQLAWSTMPQGETGQATIFVSDPEGTDVRSVYAESFQNNAPSHLVVQGWSPDGDAVLFSREPWGIGGYIPFPGASSLFRVSLSDGHVSPLIAFDPRGRGGLCFDSLSPDGSTAASHCPPAQISLESLSNGGTATINPPSDIDPPFITGTARFSPDGKRVAFALARGNPDDEHGWVAISGGLSGASSTITDRSGGFYQVVSWLNSHSLLLQWVDMSCGAGCPGDSLWTIDVDGSGLTHLAEGHFVALTSTSQP